MSLGAALNRGTTSPELYLAHSAPLYERAIGAILEFIDNNGYEVGDRLPSESDFSSDLGISRSTLREALMELKNQGVIERRHGVGTFVAEPPPAALHGGLEELKSLRNLSSRSDVVVERSDWRVEHVAASDEISDVLDVELDAPLVRVRSAASIDGVRCATLDSYISESLVDFAEVEEYDPGSLLDYLMERQSPLVARTNSDIVATSVAGPAARWLEVEDGTPVLHLREVFLTVEGHPVLFSLNNFLTEIISFHIVRKVF
jgi:GntR family transcriptional regulator